MAKPDTVLWADSNRGVYIPKHFAESFIDRAKAVSGVSDDEWKILEAGPDTPWHWETWDNVLNNATVTDENGVKYRLYQDGDLWLIPEGMEWDDDTETHKWPEEASADE